MTPTAGQFALAHVAFNACSNCGDYVASYRGGPDRICRGCRTIYRQDVALAPTPAQIEALKVVVRWCRENGIELKPELSLAAGERSP